LHCYDIEVFSTRIPFVDSPLAAALGFLSKISTAWSIFRNSPNGTHKGMRNGICPQFLILTDPASVPLGMPYSLTPFCQLKVATDYLVGFQTHQSCF
jgi:hypothetical protein